MRGESTNIQSQYTMILQREREHPKPMQHDVTARVRTSKAYAICARIA